LAQWEKEINQMESPRVSVENKADLEGPPRHMTYVTESKPSEGIVIPDDPVIGCECETACSVQGRRR
jgi:histone-lysine N-methyltransferase SUV39H